MSEETEEARKLRRLDAYLESEEGELDFDALRAEITQARITVKKAKLREIRAQLDNERESAQIIPFDRERQRTRLAEIMSRNDMAHLTLAARGDGPDDLDALLDDLAALDTDTSDSRQ